MKLSESLPKMIFLIVDNIITKLLLILYLSPQSVVHERPMEKMAVVFPHTLRVFANVDVNDPVVHAPTIVGPPTSPSTFCPSAPATLLHSVLLLRLLGYILSLCPTFLATFCPSAPYSVPQLSVILPHLHNCILFLYPPFQLYSFPLPHPFPVQGL